MEIESTKEGIKVKEKQVQEKRGKQKIKLIKVEVEKNNIANERGKEEMI